MKKLILAAALFGAFATVSVGSSLPVVAADTFSFRFNTGDVAFAYSDGYWDKNRRWHKWRNAREAREYRNRYAHNYYNHRHDRDRRNMGWRGDQDRDGVPNRFDRDRDGDGTPNRFDDRPSNPRRD